MRQGWLGNTCRDALALSEQKIPVNWVGDTKWQKNPSSRSQPKAVMTTKPRTGGGGVGGSGPRGHLATLSNVNSKGSAIKKRTDSRNICCLQQCPGTYNLISLPLRASVSPYWNLKKSYCSPTWVSDPSLLPQNFTCNCLPVSLN